MNWFLVASHLAWVQRLNGVQLLLLQSGPEAQWMK